MLVGHDVKWVIGCRQQRPQQFANRDPRRKYLSDRFRRILQQRDGRTVLDSRTRFTLIARMVVRHIVGQDMGKRDGMIDIEIGRTPTGGRQFPIAFRLEFIHRWDTSLLRVPCSPRLLRR